MKILVTGGAGYIGSNAVYRLIKNNHKVVIVDNLSRGYVENIHPKATFYKVDIRNKNDLTNVFVKEKNIDVVMDFAAWISVFESTKKPIEYFSNNFSSVQNLMEVMNAQKVRNIIFSSTAAVYGEPKRVPVQEDDKKTPINPYGASKLAAELFIQAYSSVKNMNYIIFRYFNVGGTNKSLKVGIRDKKVTHLIPSVNNLALGIIDSFSIYGTNYKTKDGSCIRDYIHVVDLVDAHILAAEKLLKEKTSNIFNLSSDNGFSVIEIIKETEKLLGKKLNINYGDRRKGDPSTLLADNSKAKRELNWTPTHNLVDIIKSDYLFRQKVFK